MAGEPEETAEYTALERLLPMDIQKVFYNVQKGDIQMEANKYCRMDFNVGENVEFVKIVRPDGNEDVVYPFIYQPIKVSYDEEGIETIEPTGGEEMHCRYTPDFTGEATVEFHGAKMSTLDLNVLPSDSHGYVEIGKTDGKYFACSDRTPFFSVGINTAFPTVYGKSNGTEFGLSGTYRYIGLRQYERWFKRLSENGVNVARVWLGHTYFNPDTEQVYKLDYKQFSKIDMLVELARKYSIKLKLTLEQFRFFNYEKTADSASYEDHVFRLFNKRLYDGDERCNSSTEWLSDDRWRKAWLFKVGEFAKRYSGDTAVFAIELWNEMNCVGDFKSITEWNRNILPEVKKLFPKNLVCNSLGSLDSEHTKNEYNSFCWDKSDFVQIHRYLDQGALYEDCRNNPLAAVKGAFDKVTTDKPIFIAETGAVNNCHSGPFKFYVNDDRGIIFADLVYTPVFLKSAGTGNIWHWDEKYVEFKNLYHMFKPVKELISGVDFENENFVSTDLSDERVSLLLLKGKTVALGYIRNKADNWKNILRDLHTADPIESFEFELADASGIQCIRIWNEDRTEVNLHNGKVCFKNIKYGMLFKVMI